jgi:hypothetical protein
MGTLAHDARVKIINWIFLYYVRSTYVRLYEWCTNDIEQYPNASDRRTGPDHSGLWSDGPVRRHFKIGSQPYLRPLAPWTSTCLYQYRREFFQLKCLPFRQQLFENKDELLIILEPLSFKNFPSKKYFSDHFLSYVPCTYECIRWWFNDNISNGP